MISKKFLFFFCTILLAVTIGILTAFLGLLDKLTKEGEAVLINIIAPQEHDIIASPNTRAQFSATSAESNSSNLHYIGRFTPIFENIGDEVPADTIYLHTVQVSLQRGDWKLINTGDLEKWIYTNWLPEETLMYIPALNQQALGLPTGCEIVAFTMLVNSHVDVDVFTLIEEMPRSYDPKQGFRGDPFSPGGFTIFPPALMDMMERYMGSSKNMTGLSIEDLQAHLALERPIIAWLRGMHDFTVHAITLTGFNRYGFFYNDPWTGEENAFITYDDFSAMWEDPIQDLRLNRIHSPRIAMSF